jgi:hypothetical protein
MALALISVRDALDSAVAAFAARNASRRRPRPMRRTKRLGILVRRGVDSLTRVASPSIPTKEPENKSPGVEV